MHAEGAVSAWVVYFGHSQFFASLVPNLDRRALLTQFSKMLDDEC